MNIESITERERSERPWLMARGVQAATERRIKPKQDQVLRVCDGATERTFIKGWATRR